MQYNTNKFDIFNIKVYYVVMIIKTIRYRNMFKSMNLMVENDENLWNLSKVKGIYKIS